MICFAEAVTFKPVGSNQASTTKVSSPPGYAPRLEAKRGDSFIQADLPGLIRTTPVFLQGVIQVAAAFHHFQRGNLAGTASLLRSALRRLNVYPEAFAGVAVAPLRATIRLWLDAFGTPTRSPLPSLPQLQIASTGLLSSNPVSG